MELERLKAGLEQMEDPRQTNGGHILHKLEDIIIIGLCTVVCGGEDFPDMEEFGKERNGWRHSWNFPMAYLIVTRFVGYLNE